jgi:hypothetical protein
MLSRISVLALTLGMCTCIINLELISGQNTCFSIQGGQEYRVEYMFSGVNETNGEFRLMRGDQIMLYVTNRTEYNELIMIPEGLIDLCFSPGDSANKMLSIDFFPSTDAVKSLITTHDLKAIYSELNRLQGELQETFRNQQFQAERDFVHRNVLESTENHIKWLGVLKVFLLLGSALVQLWIMKGFLRNKVQPYEPVS